MVGDQMEAGVYAPHGQDSKLWGDVHRWWGVHSIDRLPWFATVAGMLAPCLSREKIRGRQLAKAPDDFQHALFCIDTN